jgi:hypothetical protein
MRSAGSPVPGRHDGAAETAGAPKAVRFFSVEGQRRRLEFATRPPARAMTPEEETRYLGELQAQEEAARKQAEADQKAAREGVAREKAGRSRAAPAGGGSRAVDGVDDGRAQPAAPGRGRARHGRHAGDTDDESVAEAGRRSGGRRAVTGSGDAPSTSRGAAPAPAPAQPASRTVETPAETRRGMVSRRGVIGASQPRAEE